MIPSRKFLATTVFILSEVIFMKFLRPPHRQALILTRKLFPSPEKLFHPEEIALNPGETFPPKAGGSPNPHPTDSKRWGEGAWQRLVYTPQNEAGRGEDNTLASQRQHSREVGWVKGRLDDPSIDGQDGEDDTTQEDQGKLVDILDTHKYHSGHTGEHTGAIHTHVVQHGGCLPTGILCLEDGHSWEEISLQEVDNKVRRVTH